MSDDHLMKLIGYNVQGTAEWRGRKAEEFPEDTRNLKAAEELERLAAEIETLEHSEIFTVVRKINTSRIKHPASNLSRLRLP